MSGSVRQYDAVWGRIDSVDSMEQCGAMWGSGSQFGVVWDSVGSVK